MLVAECMVSICDKCHMFKVFGKKCWYFWEDKKTCSQFRKTEADEPHCETSLDPVVEQSRENS